MKTTRKARRGFTLIELVAVMVVLAILAGVAIPRYFDYADRARTSSLQGALGGMRTGIANYYTDSIINGSAAYPDATGLSTIGDVLQEKLPANPYNGLNTVQVIASSEDAAARAVSNTSEFGWNYFVDNDSEPPVAILWANSEEETTEVDENGDPVPANEL